MLPSYAATAWYYSEKKENLEDIINKAYEFCSEKYVRALYLGNRMSVGEKQDVARELSDITGIDRKTILRCDLRITGQEFLRYFQEENGVTISPYDTRFTGRYTSGIKMHDPVGDDELMAHCMPGFLGAFHEICETVLGIEMERNYQVINFNVNKS